MPFLKVAIRLLSPPKRRVGSLDTGESTTANNTAALVPDGTARKEQIVRRTSRRPGGVSRRKGDDEVHPLAGLGEVGGGTERGLNDLDALDLATDLVGLRRASNHSARRNDHNGLAVLGDEVDGVGGEVEDCHEASSFLPFREFRDFKVSQSFLIVASIIANKLLFVNCIRMS